MHASKQPAALGRFAAIWTALAGWNPKPGVFLNDLGGLLESRFRFDAAEVCYRRAVAVTPQLPEAKSALGMLLMRIGKLGEAHTMLDEAFQADPFHMRVSNFRKVLKLLDGYQVITTEHFVIRVDSQLDKLLGGYMAEYWRRSIRSLSPSSDLRRRSGRSSRSSTSRGARRDTSGSARGWSACPGSRRSAR